MHQISQIVFGFGVWGIRGLFPTGVEMKHPINPRYFFTSLVLSHKFYRRTTVPFLCQVNVSLEMQQNLISYMNRLNRDISPFPNSGLDLVS